MNIGIIRTQSSSIEEMQKNQRTDQNRKEDVAKQTTTTQGDTIEISEEGRRKSAALQTDASTDNSSEGETNSDSTSSDTQAASSVNVADLKKELQKKKSEVKTKQAKLDEAKQAAENDPSKEAQMKKLKSQVTQLEKEASKIRSKVYSS